MSEPSNRRVVAIAVLGCAALASYFIFFRTPPQAPQTTSTPSASASLPQRADADPGHPTPLDARAASPRASAAAKVLRQLPVIVPPSPGDDDRFISARMDQLIPGASEQQRKAVLFAAKAWIDGARAGLAADGEASADARWLEERKRFETAVRAALPGAMADEVMKAPPIPPLLRDESSAKAPDDVPPEPAGVPR